jgi:hypothetical protein
VDRRFAGVSSVDADEGCHLHDRWQAIHFLLTGDPDSVGPPLGWLKRGEFQYSGASDPSYGMSAAAVADFAAALRTVSEQELRARFDATDLRAAGPKQRPIPPGRWGPPGDAGTFLELVSYFRRLTHFVSRTAQQASAIIFCRYEDW